MNTVSWTNISSPGNGPPEARQSPQIALLPFPFPFPSTPLAATTSAHSSPDADDRLTIMGGCCEGRIVESAATYSFQTALWSTLIPEIIPCHANGAELLHSSPLFASSASSASDASCLYIFGGLISLPHSGDGTKIVPTNQLVKYDPMTNRMTFLSPPEIHNHPGPSPRVGSSMIYIPAYSDKSSKLLVFGGLIDTLTVANDTWCFDLSNMTWTAVLTTGVLPIPRESAACVYLPPNATVETPNDNAHMILHGGTTGSTKHRKRRLADMHRLDLDTFVWEKVEYAHTKLRPNARALHSAHMIEEVDGTARKMFLVGGVGQDDDLLSDCWIYDHDTSEWSYTRTLNGNDGKPFSPASHHASASIENRVYIFGGCDSTKKPTHHLVKLEVGPPHPVENITATPTPENRLSLAWDDPHHHQHYRIYLRPSDSESYSSLVKDIHDLRECEIDFYPPSAMSSETPDSSTGLLPFEPGSEYEVYVFSVNAAGESLYWVRDHVRKSTSCTTVTIPASDDDDTSVVDEDSSLPEAIMCSDVVEILWPDFKHDIKAYRDCTSNFCRDLNLKRLHGTTRIRHKVGTGKPSYVLSSDVIPRYVDVVAQRFGLDVPDSWRQLLADHLDGAAQGNAPKVGRSRKLSAKPVASKPDPSADDLPAEDGATADSDHEDAGLVRSVNSTLSRSHRNSHGTLPIATEESEQPPNGDDFMSEETPFTTTTRSGRQSRRKLEVVQSMHYLAKQAGKKEKRKGGKRNRDQDDDESDSSLAVPLPATGARRSRRSAVVEDNAGTEQQTTSEEAQSPPRKKARGKKSSTLQKATLAKTSGTESKDVADVLSNVPDVAEAVGARADVEDGNGIIDNGNTEAQQQTDAAITPEFVNLLTQLAGQGMLPLTFNIPQNPQEVQALYDAMSVAAIAATTTITDNELTPTMNAAESMQMDYEMDQQQGENDEGASDRAPSHSPLSDEGYRNEDNTESPVAPSVSPGSPKTVEHIAKVDDADDGDASPGNNDSMSNNKAAGLHVSLPSGKDSMSPRSPGSPQEGGGSSVVVGERTDMNEIDLARTSVLAGVNVA
ncbi:hypothetical protein SeMB42_g04212 [Synchytrium endobioticum]|uniref:Fibronectin type-III domain-containing protein n=1 Tax=Synchytrium endobioticum TaxID=286115 RepID=A0A507CIR7_9FUNG|nr:hypothetical protein SeLEV6574_g07200 [Synchytrium endobioticum]TPX44758.1 hypothetical protein SeMB42_g04212 [Synchytrium endobioticum]